MHQICAAAQMSPGALYRYFPSKEAIIEAIAQEDRSKARTILEIMRQPGSFVDRIVACGMAYIRSMQEDNGGRLMIEICAETLRNTSVAERFSCMEEDIRTQFRTEMQAAQERGEIDAHADLDASLFMLMSVADGIVLRMTLDGKGDPEVIEPMLRRMATALLVTDGARMTTDRGASAAPVALAG